MIKSAGFLLLLGLAIGLWLGFNPQAHEKVVQSWNDAKASYMRIQKQVMTQVNGWTTQLGSTKQTASNSVGSVPKWINTAWHQLASIFNTIWSSARKLWLSLAANLNMSNPGLKK